MIPYARQVKRSELTTRREDDIMHGPWKERNAMSAFSLGFSLINTIPLAFATTSVVQLVDVSEEGG